VIHFREDGTLVLDGSVPSTPLIALQDNILLSLATPLGSLFQRPEFGSELYLLRRAKASSALPERAENMVRTALQWMIDSGRLDSVDVTPQWLARDCLGIYTAVTSSVGSINVPYWIPVPNSEGIV